MRIIRIVLAIMFWLVNLWWLGHAVQAFRNAPDGTFRIYSVQNADSRIDGWGMVFSGHVGQALALAYIVLVVHALLASILARGVMWIVAMLVLLAWGTLFAGNSYWLEQWTDLEWWDVVNYVGLGVVLLHLVLNIGRVTIRRGAAEGS